MTVTVSIAVTDCLAAFGDEARVTSSSLAAFLSGRAGASVSQNRLARLLRPHGIVPTTARVGGKPAKAYRRSAFEGSTATVTLPATETVTAAPVATVAPRIYPPAPGSRCAYCGELGADATMTDGWLTATLHRACEDAWMQETAA